MKRLRTWLLGIGGLFVYTSCGLFEPSKPYDQGDRPDPLVLDQQHPETSRRSAEEGCKPIDYLLPWRLGHCMD